MEDFVLSYFVILDELSRVVSWSRSAVLFVVFFTPMSTPLMSIFSIRCQMHFISSTSFMPG